MTFFWCEWLFFDELRSPSGCNARREKERAAHLAAAHERLAVARAQADSLRRALRSEQGRKSRALGMLSNGVQLQRQLFVSLQAMQSIAPQVRAGPVRATMRAASCYGSDFARLSGLRIPCMAAK
jgi:hypothetical protein